LKKGRWKSASHHDVIICVMPNSGSRAGGRHYG
jgi:hypothetical protein